MFQFVVDPNSGTIVFQSSDNTTAYQGPNAGSNLYSIDILSDDPDEFDPVWDGQYFDIHAGWTYYGGDADNVIQAGDGDDTIYGDGGDDTLKGGGGDDIIYDGLGEDHVYGQNGDDLFYATDDAHQSAQLKTLNWFYGGSGIDRISYENSALSGLIDLMDGIGYRDGFYYDNYESIENATGSHQSDTIHGTDGDNDLVGLGGGDTISGHGGDDTIHGGLGEDFLDGGSGNDTVFFADNAECIEIDLNTEIADHFTADDPDNPAYFEFIMNFENVVGTDFNDEIRGSAVGNTLEGGKGDDYIHGRRGDDTLLGNQGDDTLEGGLGDDILKGGKGDDTLFGGHGGDHGLELGGDTLFGGSGDDTLFAGEGNNEAFGGDGDDLFLPDLDGVDDPTGVFANNLVATGGADSDTFVFVDGISSTSLRITDFDDTEDFIEFRGIEKPGGWLTPHIGRPVNELDDLDTIEDGIITIADFGWELTTDGTGLKFTTNNGATLIIEGVNSFDADALIIG